MYEYVVSEIEKVQDSLLVVFAKGKGEDLCVKWSVSVFAKGKRRKVKKIIKKIMYLCKAEVGKEYLVGMLLTRAMRVGISGGRIPATFANREGRSRVKYFAQGGR